jgi:polyhydroxyalkanoate synthesis repressor PhaR
MAKREDSTPGKVIIKKYSNRRLYDSTNKRYVTLEDISELIREGNEVKVIDSQTGADISKVILIQVVLESEKNKEDILPASFLHMLIKYGNKVAKDYFENYFLMMFQPYLSVQDNFKKNMRMWQDMGWSPPGLGMPPGLGGQSSADEKMSETDMKVYMKNMQEALRQREKAASAEPDKDVEILMEKIQELEKKVKSLDTEK